MEDEALFLFLNEMLAGMVNHLSRHSSLSTNSKFCRDFVRLFISLQKSVENSTTKEGRENMRKKVVEAAKYFEW